MNYKRLYVLIEGANDEQFIEAVIKPILSAKYNWIKPYQYQQKTRKTIKALISSIEKIDFADYFFLRDINDSPCVAARFEIIKTKYAGRIDVNNIIVVVKEIESWYLAGLDDKKCQELGLGTFSHTDDIAKEQFNRLMPKKFDSRIDFMAEILKRFSIETAKQKNASFSYFMRKI